jgi:hypothetical protein
MPFCPGCGLNLEQLAAPAFAPGGAATPERPLPAPTLHGAPGAPTAGPLPPVSTAEGRALSDGTPRYEGTPSSAERRASVVSAAMNEARTRRVGLPALIAILVAVLIVGLALGGTGLGPRIGGSATATQAPSPTAAGPTLAPTSEAPPFGLLILSPLDGAVVGSRQITVIGSAPAGITVVHDVPMWFDSKSTADGTGHWAMTVDLNKGENRLKFRLGDDKSTAKEIRVTYAPPGG